MSSKGDIIDQANAAAEVFHREAITRRQPEGPPATGYCLNCDAHLAPKQRWCNLDCRADWEKTERAKAFASRDLDPAA